MSQLEEINRALVARVAVATRRIKKLETENAALQAELEELQEEVEQDNGLMGDT